MKIMQKIVMIFLIITITSCNNVNKLSRQESQLKTRGDFHSYLALEYLDYIRILQSNGEDGFFDKPGTNFFAKKGLRAAKYQDVFPENPEKWNVSIGEIEDTKIAREKMVMMMFNPRVRKIFPIQLAYLEVIYDCWVTREQDKKRVLKMAKCKKRFNALLAEMEEYLNKPKFKSEVIKTEIPKPDIRKYDLRFNLDNHKFTEESEREFLEIIEYLHHLNGNYKILLVGAADRTARRLYNDRLAKERALFTKNILLKNGVPEHLLEVKSDGEYNPEIITKNSRQNQFNRRVSVYVLKGNDSLDEIPLPLLENFTYKEEIIQLKKSRGER